MFGTILEQSVWVYVIAAAGIFGIGAKLILNGWLKGLVKGTGNMRSTRKRPLVEIRKRYEELAYLDVGIHDTRSFVDRYICRLKLGKTYAASWDMFCRNMMMIAAGTGIAGMWWQYKNGMQAGYSAQTFIFGIVACTVMQIVYNMCDSGRKKTILAAELVNYLDNSLGSRIKKEQEKAEESMSHEKTESHGTANARNGKREAAATMLEPNVIDIDAALAKMDEAQTGGDALMGKAEASAAYMEKMQKKRTSRQKKAERQRKSPEKLSGKESPREVTEEQIAACDALFDKLLEGISTT